MKTRFYKAIPGKEVQFRSYWSKLCFQENYPEYGYQDYYTSQFLVKRVESGKVYLSQVTSEFYSTKPGSIVGVSYYSISEIVVTTEEFSQWFRKNRAILNWDRY